MGTHRTLTNIPEVFERLGGIQAVADLTGRKYKAAWMWIYLDKFPTDTYLIIKGALSNKGLKAKDALWGMSTSAKEVA